jgi:glycosidase
MSVLRKLMRLTLPLLIVLSLLPIFLTPSFSAIAADETPTYHNSRNLTFRSPFGAVTTGTTVTLRIHTPAGLPDSVLLRVYDLDAQTQAFYEMTKVLTTPQGFDYWEYKLKTPDKPTVLQYRFIIRKGDTLIYYEDDTKDEKGTYNIAKKGGTGTALTDSRNQNWQITVFTPDFTTPKWMHNGVIYQMFPDRFRNGDTSNDPKDGSDTFYGNLKLKFHSTWNEKMEDAFKRDPSAPPNSDFYGGDLKGVIEKIDYLKALGVTVLYFNPIFEARSNHRYDTADYKQIDHILGTQADWDALVKAANNAGMKIVLDGVFNHMSSDSPVFDRYHRFPGDEGACESVSSKYRDWFYFRKPQPKEAPNACVDDGKGDRGYESWFGFDSIPKMNNENPQVRAFIYGDPDSVARHWLKAGSNGWRLDVAGDIDNGSSQNPYWEQFRKAVKETNPDAVIIAEIWDDVSMWVTGTQMDSTMNYRMRGAIMSFAITKPFADNDVSWQPATPADFDGMVMAQIEDYPPQAMFAMMNLVDSHDTSRLSFMVDHDSQSQKLAAFLQFVMPGAPTIYYGDEIALKADSVDSQDDPYNRAPYPWEDTKGNFYPAPDKDMLAYYQTLAKMRADNPALRTGNYRTLLADDKGLYAVLRSGATGGADNAAVVIANRASDDIQFNINVPACLDNATLTNAVGGDKVTVTNGQLSGTAKARSGAVYNGSAVGDCTNAEQGKGILKAIASDAKVELTLPNEANATYDVYRSYFIDSGFVKLTEQPIKESFVDASVANGYRYYYYVQPHYTTAKVSTPSNIVMAAPGGKITAVEVAPEASDNQTVPYSTAVSYKGFNVTAKASVESTVKQHLIAEIALVAKGTDAKSIKEWQSLTLDKAFALRPTQAGDVEVIARVSADAGETWTYSKPLAVMVKAPSSTTKPDAPANLKVDSAKPFKIILLWDSVPNAAGYRVYKGSSENRRLIAEVTETGYSDRNALEGETYSYTVTAVDESLNESDAPKEVTASVKLEGAVVTFKVKVPDNTPKDAPVFLAGDFGTPDYPQWNPGAEKMKMTNNGDGTYQITLKLPTGSSPQYKYVRGTWDAVEKGPQCEEIANRQILVKGGESTVNDEVAKWRDIDQCK